MSEAEYTIAEIVGSRDWDGGGDPSRATTYWTFKIAGDSQQYEIGRKPGKPLTVGESFRAETKGEKYGKISLKRVQAGNFNGGKRDEPFKADPAKQRSIMRQSAQKAALEYAALRHQQGKLPDDFDYTKLKPIIDWFYEDAHGAMTTEPPAAIAPPRTEQW